MINNYTDYSFPFLDLDETIDIDFINTWKSQDIYQDIPIIKNGGFLGYLSIENLSENVDIEKIDKLTKEDLVLIDQHPYQVLDKLSRSTYDYLPVISDEALFEGMIHGDSLMPFWNDSIDLFNEFGIIVLEVSYQQYSLAEISKIVEMNDAHIIQSTILNNENSNHSFSIHLKINKVDLKNIILTFERYEYIIQQVYHVSDLETDYKNKLDAFFNYLNI